MPEIKTEIETEVPADIDPIKPIYEAECPSLSGRSVLTFVVGRNDDDNTLHLRIAGNSGKGMWFDGWASAEAIEAIVKGSTELTAKSFHSLHQGRSINTGGFVQAALRELGLIRPNAENTRHHEHVPSMTLEKCVMEHVSQAKEKDDSAGAAPAKSARRKGKETN